MIGLWPNNAGLGVRVGAIAGEETTTTPFPWDIALFNFYSNNLLTQEDVTNHFNVVPEPSTYLMLVLSIVAGLFYRYRQRKVATAWSYV